MIVLLIPAYRPAHRLLDLINQVVGADPERVIASILLVDDGSGLEFRQLFATVETLPRTCVIRHAINLGKGAALKTGFNYIFTIWPEAAAVVTADADGQHAAHDIVRIARMMNRSPAQPVLGYRQFGEDVPWRSRVGNRITRVVTRLATGLKVEDTQTGLRGWTREMCLASLPIPANGYDFEMESLLKSQTSSLLKAVRQEPIETIYLDGNSSSHFNPLWDSMRIYYVFFRYCASSVATMLTDNTVFVFVLSQTQHVAASQVCGRACGIVVNFAMARKVVFRSKGSWKRPLLEFVALVVVMGIVSYGMIQFLHTRYGLSYLTAKLLAEGALFLGNFAIQRDFIFSRATKE
ncbi:MAG TPA: bifunctional glycosyltransferase family 2/GtrA family protein [Bryobacteraceae bacterium]|nr:bifunctional glycosyltransferase family 2/GtrA family protein [Bryobacteraceae bacterium]